MAKPKSFQSVKRVKEAFDESESDVWNASWGFSTYKVLKPLILMNKYNAVAQFGVEEVGQEEGIDENILKKRRVTGLKRFLSIMRELLEDTYFVINKNDKDYVLRLITKLRKLEDSIMPYVYSSYEDAVDKEQIFNINEELFHKVLRLLQDLRMKINTPLNKAHLIFKESTEIDFDKIKEDIVEGG